MSNAFSLRRPRIIIRHGETLLDENGKPCVLIDDELHAIEIGDQLSAADIAGAVAEAVLEMAEAEINERRLAIPMYGLTD